MGERAAGGQARGTDAGEVRNVGVSAREAIIFVIVSLALLMSSIDGTIVAVGLPDMITGLRTNLVWMGWVLTAYSLMQTIVMPMAGKLSDDFGRKNLFLASVALFTVSSGLCAIAPNVYLLIVFRVLQAIGGGAFMPSAAGIVSDVFGPARRGTAIGLFTSVFPMGGIIGPNVGGWVIDHLGWRAIFSVNLPLGVVLFVFGILLLPAGGRLHGARSIDLVGAGAFGAGIVGLMVAMTVWGNDVNFSVEVVVWAVLGLAALVYFVWHEGRSREPMIELRLLKERAFFAANLYNFLYGALVFGFFSFIPLYATVAYSMSATDAGFVLTPRATGMIVLSTLSSFLLTRTGYRGPMIIGTLLISAGLFLVGQGWHNPLVFGHQIDNLVLLSTVIGITGLGVGVAGPAANNAAIDLLPEAVARITGLRGMFRNTGGVLGTAALVLVLAHFKDQGHGLQVIFASLALLNLLVIPPIFLIPDTVRSRRGDAPSKVEPVTVGE
ncbi:MAG TPA: DHA2 family efflux MFS transporter permease subunit [Thermomicrobiaceae bacterium]|nr:DHA2 family efflux MFS transporter permease subunit [Thermomicrobiaceae bacterium]